MFNRLFLILLVAIFTPIAAQAAASQEYWGTIPMKISGQPVTCILIVHRAGHGITATLYALTGTKLRTASFLVGSMNPSTGRYRAKSLAPTAGVVVTMAGRIVEKKYLNAKGKIVFPAPKKQSCVFKGKILYIGDSSRK